ncbi:tetratricopeptide repeat protein [Actinoplanes sp. M2I2]|uniref:tetratricopeptide repeat protein n=1 Tax=Actinoplanes sp. M2I2 TaxID=1734444 RepID=UPI0024C24D91|nr:tetratricopeptide repeat protein [Actinoplanes sp. M2I2]
MACVSQPSPLSPARQRALALASSGDLAGARAVLEHAVELGKINLSEDDPDVLLTALQLGTVLQQADDPSAARRVLEEAYAAGQWRLGDSDALMLQISHGIGVVAEELGNRHEARKAFTRVAELGPAALGVEHPVVARARAYLGAGQNPYSIRGESAPPPPEHTPPVQQAPPGAVQPPSPANQHVWTEPPADPAPATRPNPVEEPTIAQPIISPRPDTLYPPPPTASRSAPHVPAQRSAPDYPGTSSGDPAYPGQPSSGVPHPRTPAYFGASSSGPTHPGTPGGGQVFAPAYPSDEPPPYAQGSSKSTGRKGLGVLAAVAAVVAAVVAVAALVFVLANRSSDSSDNDNVPTLAGPAPTDVALRDTGTVVTVTWTDPTEASVSFLVIMGRPGLELKPVGTLGPGQTSFEMSGLNASVNYCFAVVAVYRGDQFATSPQACTSRASATPR